MAKPLPPFLSGSLLICTSATMPKIKAIGAVKMPNEQHQPTVTLTIPSTNEATAKLCCGFTGYAGGGGGVQPEASGAGGTYGSGTFCLPGMSSVGCSVGLTLGGSSLLYLLIQKGAATAVTSLLYLVPPCTAVMAWLLFGEAITASALSGRCEQCAEALEIFVEAYGAEAGNLALRSVATAGVYVGGGIAPKILPALVSGAFMDAFRDKEPMVDLLRTLPVTVILNPAAGLLGAAVRAVSLQTV